MGDLTWPCLVEVSVCTRLYSCDELEMSTTVTQIEQLRLVEYVCTATGSLFSTALLEAKVVMKRF